MAQSFTHSRHSLRGPRIVKTSRGIISMAAVIGAAVLLVPMSAAAQDTYLAGSFANAVSADGAVAIGELQNENNQTRAFRWDSVSGAMRDLGTLRPDNSGYSSATAVRPTVPVVLGGSTLDVGAHYSYRWYVVCAAIPLLSPLRAQHA